MASKFVQRQECELAVERYHELHLNRYSMTYIATSLIQHTQATK